MAGSMKNFLYTTDFGDEFVINMDESNGEQVGNTDYSPLDGVRYYFLPRNIKPRAAIYRSFNGLVTRKITLTNPTQTVATLPQTFNVTLADGNGTVAVQLASVDGEKYKRIPSPTDTGLLDGDID